MVEFGQFDGKPCRGGRFGDGAPFESLFERFWVPENPNDLAGQMITFVPTGPASYRWIR